MAAADKLRKLSYKTWKQEKCTTSGFSHTLISVDEQNIYSYDATAYTDIWCSILLRLISCSTTLCGSLAETKATSLTIEVPHYVKIPVEVRRIIFGTNRWRHWPENTLHEFRQARTPAKWLHFRTLILLSLDLHWTVGGCCGDDGKAAGWADRAL